MKTQLKRASLALGIAFCSAAAAFAQPGATKVSEPTAQLTFPCDAMITDRPDACAPKL